MRTCYCRLRCEGDAPRYAALQFSKQWPDSRLRQSGRTGPLLKCRGRCGIVRRGWVCRESWFGASQGLRFNNEAPRPFWSKSFGTPPQHRVRPRHRRAAPARVPWGFWPNKIRQLRFRCWGALKYIGASQQQKTAGRHSRSLWKKRRLSPTNHYRERRGRNQIRWREAELSHEVFAKRPCKSAN